MEETGGGAEFRHPFEDSESEAAEAAASFRQITKDFYPPVTDDEWASRITSGQDAFIRSVNVKIGDTMNARLDQHMNTRTRKVISEQVSLYEAGETDETRGPKICDYIDCDGKVLRFDAPDSEQRQMELAAEAEAPVTEDSVREMIKNTFEGASLEQAMGLNGGAIGTEEVEALRGLFSDATPLPPNPSEK